MEAQRERLMLKQMQQAEKLQNAKAKGKGKGKAATTPQANAQTPPQPQSDQPVWVDEFGRPVVNHHHRPRNRAKTPSAAKLAAEQPAKP